MSSKTARLEIMPRLGAATGIEMARGSNLSSSFDVYDGLKLALVPLLAWLLGHGSQNAKQKIDAANSEQSANKMLWERVDKLENKVEGNTNNIFSLHEDKMRLNAEIIDLKRQIASLQIKKEEYESKEIIHIAQIAALEEMLIHERHLLQIAENKLQTLNSVPDDK